MTILPKKKTGKEKSTADQNAHDGTSHHHSTTHHPIPESRVRLENPTIRNAAHPSSSLDDRHRGTRHRLTSDFVTHQNSVDNSTAATSHGTSYDSSESTSPCISGDNSSSHARVKPPSPELIDLSGTAVPSQSCDSVVNPGPDVQPLVVKRRHGRLSPHSQPYARNKTVRSAVQSSTESSPDCSSATTSSLHHGASRRHHSLVSDDRTPISPPASLGATNSARNNRRRQRVRPDGKEERSGNNSDDEDLTRLRRLNQGVNFEELEIKFAQALKEMRGFLIKEMVEDGACLFRAVAEQVYGDQSMHDEVRRNCMDYMMKNSDFFSNYVTEDFVAYVGRKRLPHTHGNHLEMQAMAEMYNRSFEVYQYSTEPINTFQSSNLTDNDPIRVSYHRSTHYNAVINPYKASVGVGLGLPSFRPGLADRMLLQEAQRTSEQTLLEEQMLQDKLQAADWENTEEEMLREVAQKSVADYLQHQKELSKSSANTKNQSNDENCTSKQPTCSHDSSSSQELPTSQRDPNHDDNVAGTSQGMYSSASYGNPGLGDWVDESEESTVLAQVMAQSQREYYDALTRPSDHDDASSATCSKYTSPH